MEKAFCDYLQNTPECYIVWTELLKEEKVVEIVGAPSPRYR